MITHKFIDLKENDFPFSVFYVNAQTGDLLEMQEITGPGALMVRGRTGEPPVDVTVSWPDGTLVVNFHDGTTEVRDGRKPC